MKIRGKGTKKNQLALYCNYRGQELLVKESAEEIGEKDISLIKDLFLF